MSRSLLAYSLALAIPASLLTNESFRPVEHRCHLDRGESACSFALFAPEPLLVECDLNVRTATGERPRVTFRVNQIDVAAIQPEQLYVTERRVVLVPAAALRAGENHLAVGLDGDAAATFDLRARIQNYGGISPRFPRAVIVPDELVRSVLVRPSGTRRALRFGVFLIASAFFLFIVGAATRSRPRWRLPVMLAPSIGLAIVLAYSAGTPLEIWLMPATAIVLASVFCAATAGLLVAASHRAAVLRAGLAAVGTFVLAEGALRLVNVVRPSFIFYSDSYSRFRGRPGAAFFDSRLNANGFNDVDHERSRPPGISYRIVAIGDSFAFGVVPYRANYLRLLESGLAAGGPVEVVKLGVPAAEPRDYAAILVREGLAFHPDLVIVGFFIGNDFEETAKRAYESSYVAMLLRFVWRLWRAGPVLTMDPGVSTYEDDRPSMSDEQFLEIEVERAGIYRTSDESTLRALTARAGKYLREMDDISRRAGSDFLVIVLPDQVQIDPALQREIARASGVRIDRLDFQLPNRLLAEELARHRIRRLDLLPAFEAEGRRVRLYKPNDTHWNVAGNRLAASRIAAFLREAVRK